MTTSRRGLVIGLVLGVPVMLFGIRSAFLDARDTHPVELGTWLIGAAVAHDLVLLPLVGALAWALRRVIPAPAWPAVRGGALVAGTLALVAWPFAVGYGASPANPSLLPRDYVLGPLLAEAGILAVISVGGVIALARHRRARASDVALVARADSERSRRRRAPSAHADPPRSRPLGGDGPA